MGKLISRFRALWLLLVCLLLPSQARAFCGFFVSGADGALVNDATQVALMRRGVRTMLAMRNSYQGPLDDFALVIPVPVILQKENVRTLQTSLFDRLNQLTSPRLVEYWEQDPCLLEQEEALDRFSDNKEGGTGTRAKGEEGSMGIPKPLVRVEAEFSVDEYEIVILSADDASALDVWLRQNGYKIPAGIEPYLRPYVASGSKFFVAKVNAAKVKFSMGRAMLSPLRFHYDSDRFELPIRLGLANAAGPQDLVVYLLGEQRFEVANYDNVFIPTNLEVKNEVRDQFGSFYAALFDRTVAGKPRAVVTEYAWSASSCDPCPTPPLGDEDTKALSEGAFGKESLSVSQLSLTRLHARYSRETLGDDLVFRPAPAVAGGNEMARDRIVNSHGAQPSSSNSFQGRYIIRHPWQGPISCDNPDFGLWGGPPEGMTPPPPPRVDAAVKRDVPLDDLILEHPETGLDHRSLSTRAYYLLRRHLVARPTLAVLAGLLVPLAVIVASLRRRAGLGPSGLLALLLLAPGFSSLHSLSSYDSPLRKGAVGLLSRAMRDSFRDLLHPHLLLAAYLVSAGAVALWHGRRARGERPPFWAGASWALVPLLTGALLFRFSAGNAAAVALSPSVDIWSRGRVLAQGESESLMALVVGCCASALLLVALGSSRGDQAKEAPRGLRTQIALVGALVAVLLVGAFLSQDDGTRGSLWPFWWLLMLVGWSTAGALKTAGRWPEAEGRERFAGELLEGLGALLLAGLLVGWAIAWHREALGLGALSGESVAISQMALLMTRTTLAERAWLAASPLVALALAAPSLFSLATLGLKQQRLSLASLRPALLALALPLLGFFALASLSMRWLDLQHSSRQIKGSERLAVEGLEVPATRMFASRFGEKSGVMAGGLVAVNERGELLGSPSSRRMLRPFDDALFVEMQKPSDDVEAAAEPLLAVDRRKTFGQLRQALAPMLSRRQLSYRWLVGIHRPEQFEEHTRALGVHADIFAWYQLLNPLQVELLERVEVSPPSKNIPRKVLAVRADKDRLFVLELTGTLGVYYGKRGAQPDTFSRVSHHDHNQLSLGQGATRYPQELADLAFRVDEVLVVVKPDDGVEALGEILLELDWLAHRSPRRSRWSSPARRTRPLTFVVTTDDSPFR